MKLTAETFEELVSSLKGQESPGHAARKTPRVGVHVTANMIAMEEPGVAPERHSVNVRDLSVDGINILHHAPLRTGRPFVVELPRTIGPALKLLCVVRHCRMVGASLYSIGAIFRRTLSTEAPTRATASKRQ